MWMQGKFQVIWGTLYQLILLMWTKPNRYGACNLSSFRKVLTINLMKCFFISQKKKYKLNSQFAGFLSPRSSVIFAIYSFQENHFIVSTKVGGKASPELFNLVYKTLCFSFTPRCHVQITSIYSSGCSLGPRNFIMAVTSNSCHLNC